MHAQIKLIEEVKIMRDLTISELQQISGAKVFPSLDNPITGMFYGVMFGAMATSSMVEAPFFMIAKSIGYPTQKYIEAAGIIISMPFACVGGILGAPAGLMLGTAIYISDMISDRV